MFFTTHNQGGKFSASLWKMPEGAFEGDGQRMDLEEQLRISTPSSTVWSVLWDPRLEELDEDDEPGELQVVSMEHHSLRLWKLGEEGTTAKEANAIDIDPAGDRFSAVAWDPHPTSDTSELIATGVGRDIKIWDLRARRAERESISIAQAHSQTVRSLDYNPDRLHMLVSGAEDGMLKFWDVRRCAEPMKVVKGHGHWVNSIKHNNIYDQLVLSAGTDSKVKLWKMISVSSVVTNEEYEENPEGEVAEDGLIATFSDHDDSVYSVAWGDAWVFASLSYDGRMVVNQVPSAEKYSILL